MNVLYLDQYGELGGAQRCLLEVVEAAAAAGWRGAAAVPGEGELGRRLRERGLAVDPIEAGSYTMGSKTPLDAVELLARAPGLARRIARLLRESGAGLVYVNGPRLLPAAWLASGRRRPLLFHCHHRLTGRAADLARQILRFGEAWVVSASQYTLEPLASALKPGRWRVVYNGVRAPAAAVGSGRSSDAEWRIGVIGRIAPEKGQKVFLEAARLLPPARRCRFVICGAPLFGDPGGRAYHEEVRALAKGLPVEFTGQVEDSAEVLGGLDLLVAPSMTHEATTRVIPEAYAAGVAVVAFATGGIPEIVSDGETGWLVGERTAQALAGKLDSILASRREALRRTAEAGRERWRREFSLGLFQARMLAAMSCAARGAPFPEELETAARR